MIELDKSMTKVLKLALDKRNPLPILQKVCVKDNHAITTNLEQFVKMNLKEYAIIPDGIYTLSDNYLIKDETATVDDYPELEYKTPAEAYTIGKDDIKMLTRMAKVLLKDNTRPALTAVKVKQGVAYATDGYKAMRYKLNLPDCYITPKLIKMLATGKEWTIRVSDDFVEATNTTGVTLVSKSMDAMYPDLASLYKPIRYDGYYIEVDVSKDRYYFLNEEQASIKLKEADQKPGQKICDIEPIHSDGYDDSIIVMPMINRSDRKTTWIDGLQLAPLGKRVRIYATMKGQPVFVEVIK